MSDDAEEFVPGTKRPPGRWLLRGYPGELARGVLQPGSECSVVIDRGDGPEAWIGEVIERNCQGVILRLFGSGKLLVVPFVQLSRANTLPEHTWTEWRDAVECQRRGLAPCRLVDGRPVVPDLGRRPEERETLRGAGLRDVHLPGAVQRRRARLSGPIGATARGERPCRRPGSWPAPLKGPTLPISDWNLARVFEYAREHGITLQAALDRLLEVAFGRLDALRRYGQSKGLARQREKRRPHVVPSGPRRFTLAHFLIRSAGHGFARGRSPGSE